MHKAVGLSPQGEVRAPFHGLERHGRQQAEQEATSAFGLVVEEAPQVAETCTGQAQEGGGEAAHALQRPRRGHRASWHDWSVD